MSPETPAASSEISSTAERSFQVAGNETEKCKLHRIRSTGLGDSWSTLLATEVGSGGKFSLRRGEIFYRAFELLRRCSTCRRASEGVRGIERSAR